MAFKKIKQSILIGACLSVIGIPGAFAQSSVSLYGVIDTYVAQSKALGGKSATQMNTGGLSTPFWGLRGTEDLGNGVKAVFAIESFFQSNNGQSGRYPGDTFFGRGAYVGLSSGDWGKLTLGRNTTPYFLSTILFNSFFDSFAFSPIVFHTFLGNGLTGVNGLSHIQGDTDWNNSIAYSLPSWNGLSANVIYALGGQPGHLGSNKWGGNVNYSSGHFAATAAFQQVRFSGTPGDLDNIVPGYRQQSAALIGASYDFGLVKLYGQYQYMDNAIAFSDVKSNGGQVGISVPLGVGRAMASYAYSRLSGLASATRNSWAIGYDYNLSKRTDLYAAFFSDHVSSLSSASTLGVGIRTAF